MASGMGAAITNGEWQALVGLAVALAIGLLFGLERGWHGQFDRDTEWPAGVRTFGLIGLLGGVAGLLALALGPGVFGLMFLAVVAVVVTAYLVDARATGHTGITSLVAALLAFVLATLAVLGQRTTAASAAVVATLLLGFKPQLHTWVAKLDRRELQATLKLLVISVVLLPVLPDRDLGPLGALNPYQLWWMVVLIAGISYLGYFAVRIAGPRKGLVMTSLLGGLASSTALTLQMARLARTGRGEPRGGADPLAAGILMANATLFPRILVIVAAVQPALVAPLLPPLLVMTLVTAAPAFLLWWWRGRADAGTAPHVGNPLSLGLALRFGLLLALVMLLGRLAVESFGDAGVLVLAVVSGVADLNAITLSVAEMDSATLAPSVAVLAIVAATTANALFKTAVCASIGGLRLGGRVGLPLVGAGCAGLALVWLGGSDAARLTAPLARFLTGLIGADGG
ncbi:MgtC/SapB family protein [Thiococcus pfennigii]|uniref:MgtC/SapB family protein n=2 Tax=Thiococcus pfennigii TaxID=1057 RepID=UPI001F5BD9C7|nr:MgtC/SapB family protein [Thiococcus pfennigii]